MSIVIKDPDLLAVGTELTLDTTNFTYALLSAGSLATAGSGVDLQALYSKFKELWLLAAYQKFPFPMYAIDAEAGKYQLGTDGANFSGWKPANDATREKHRGGGWDEFSAAGALNRSYAGVVTLGAVGSADQLHFQRTPGGAAINFVNVGAVNEGIQVFGDATNGNFDERTYLKVFARTQGKKFDQKQLADSGYTATSARLLTFAVQNEADAKVATSDAFIAANAPYTGITITYYGADQMRTIGAGNYPFRVVINGNFATAEQIYEKVQYLLRQNVDIDSGASVTIGKTADSLLKFVGSILQTSDGVFIDNFNANDTNQIDFYDKNSIKRTFPFVAAGTIPFNSNIVGDTSAVYRMLFKTNPAGNFGTANAVTVKNAAGLDIAGTVSGASSIPFDFDYDGNVQGGRAAGTDAIVGIVVIGKNNGKYAYQEYTITRTVGLNFPIVAEKERSYSNPV